MRQFVFSVCLLFSCVGCAQTPFEVNYNVVRDTVVFIHRTSDNGETPSVGTGFTVSIPSKADPKKSYLILVTARHMVDSEWLGCPATNFDLLARFNKMHFDPKSGEIGTVDYNLSGRKWIRPDDAVDIAYAILDADKLESMDAKVTAIGLAEFPKAAELESISTGSPVLSAGLLEGLSGKRRNYPIFKFGYVSSRPDETIRAPKACLNGKELDLNDWVIAANLVPGNSGSPILYVPPRYSGARPVLLGVQSTSYISADLVGMAPIQFLINSLKTSPISDMDVSEFDRPIPAGHAKTVVSGSVVMGGSVVVK